MQKIHDVKEEGREKKKEEKEEANNKKEEEKEDEVIIILYQIYIINESIKPIVRHALNPLLY